MQLEREREKTVIVLRIRSGFLCLEISITCFDKKIIIFKAKLERR